MVAPILYDINSYIGARPVNGRNTKANWTLINEAFKDDSGHGFEGKLVGNPIIEHTEPCGNTISGTHYEIDKAIWENIVNFTIGGVFTFNQMGIAPQYLFKTNKFAVYMQSGSVYLEIEGETLEGPFHIMEVNKEYYVSLIINNYSNFATLIVNDETKVFSLKKVLANQDTLIFGSDGKNNYFKGNLKKLYLEDVANPSQDIVRFYLETKSVVISDLSVDNGTLTLTEGSTQGTYLSPLLNSVAKISDAHLTVNGTSTNAVTTVLSRSSADGSTFSSWEPISESGTLVSPANTYVQLLVTVEPVDPTGPSFVSFDRIMLDSVPELTGLITEPRIYDNNDNLTVILTSEDLSSLNLQDSTDGQEVLNFQLRNSDKASWIDNEYRVDLHYKGDDVPYNRLYVRDISQVENESGVVFDVMCEAAWYDIIFDSIMPPITIENAMPRQVMERMVSGTGWTVLNVEGDFEANDYIVEERKNRIDHLNNVRSLWGGDLVYDNVNKTVSLLTTNLDYNYNIRRRKNLKSITRKKNSQNVVTILHAEGKDGLTFASINGGKDYVENYDWYTSRGQTPPKKHLLWSDSRFTKAASLKKRAIERLADMAAPQFTFDVNILNLAGDAYFSHEVPYLRALATLYDEEELDADGNPEKIQLRIVSRNMDLLVPIRSTITLGSNMKELGDDLLFVDSI